jgi:endonuclease/exonuclease/phosphatase family metal-dependent hydrolase
LRPTDASDAPDSAGPGGGRPSFSIATFNVHAGVDGWGRPFDVIEACRVLDADVLVLQEIWTPQSGSGIAADVGTALGYTVFEQMFAGGRLAGPHPDADGRWMKSFDWRGPSHAIYLDSEKPLDATTRRSPRYLDAEPGHWGVAVLSRLPVGGHSVIDLGRLRQDRAQRFAVAVEVEVGGTPLNVVGTHMSHISYGAPVHFIRLSRAIRERVPSGPAVVAGDMNMWGPPVSAFFPGWRRAHRAKTWPAWRPHSQVDHILLRGPLTVVDGSAFASMGSDHLPLRVCLTVVG